MGQHSNDVETVPLELDAYPTKARTSGITGMFAGFGDLFRRNTVTETSDTPITQHAPARDDAEVKYEPGTSTSSLYKHWNAIKADGISASQFIAFLQPLADLDGITVSYTYSDEGGNQRVYHHRRGEPDCPNPLSRAIQEKKLSKEKALTFALNEEGRVWIESNFIELSDLKLNR
jgi:hypothetical protein